MRVMENRALSLEDIKLLVEKVHAAQQAGNCVSYSCNNYSIDVYVMIGEFDKKKEWDKYFCMYNDLPEKQRVTYDKCIKYLTELAAK